MGAVTRLGFAVPYSPHEWKGADITGEPIPEPVPFADLHDVSRVNMQPEVARLVVSGIALHFDSLRNTTRHVLPVLTGDGVPLPFIRMGGGVVRAIGLLRAVVDRQQIITAEAGARQVTPGKHGPPKPYREAVRAVDTTMLYEGRGARWRSVDDEGNVVVNSRTVSYGYAPYGRRALALVDSLHVARPGAKPGEAHLTFLPDDIVVGQPYTTDEGLLRVSAAVLVGADLPGQRIGD